MGLPGISMAKLIFVFSAGSSETFFIVAARNSRLPSYMVLEKSMDSSVSVVGWVAIR